MKVYEAIEDGVSIWFKTFVIMESMIKLLNQEILKNGSGERAVSVAIYLLRFTFPRVVSFGSRQDKTYMKQKDALCLI